MEGGTALDSSVIGERRGFAGAQARLVWRRTQVAVPPDISIGL